MSKRLKILDTIIITVNIPDHRVLAGDIGTVVEIYTKPHLAFDVEFVNPDGSTRALLTLAPEQVRPLSSADVLTTRQLPLSA
jgi:ATP-dependent exoDNAse (exonuclease V) alpha subunit